MTALARFRIVFPALFLCCLAGLSVAADVAALGPQVGARFPSALDRPDQAGRLRTLTSLMGEKGVALFFVRTADWCPFCKAQLVDINRHADAFTARGLAVATVSVDEVALLSAFVKEQGIRYTMLADPKGELNLALGIRDENYPLGTRAFGVPRPVLYVIDRQGTIRLRYMEPTYRTRPDLEAVLRDVGARQAQGELT
jgi:peroxiredoxin